MKKDKILLLGDYSGNNAGHSALLCALIHELSGLGMEIVIPTLNPKKLQRNADIHEDFVKLIGIGPQHFGAKFFSYLVFKELLAARAVLLTDNLFYDGGLFNPYKNNLFALSAINYVASKNRIPLVYYNSGVGPLSTKFGRHLARNIREGLVIVTLRDEDAGKSEIWSDYKNEIFIKADSGFNYPFCELDSNNSTQILEKFHLKSCKDWVGVNFSYHFSRIKSKNGLVRQLSKLLSFVQSQMNCGILIFVTHPLDMEINLNFKKSIGDNHLIKIVDSEKVNIREISVLAAQCKLIIGTRYHELVWFSSLGTPIIGINCGDKMVSLFKTLKIRNQLIEVEDVLSEKSCINFREILNIVEESTSIYRIRMKELKKLSKTSSLLVQNICAVNRKFC